MMLAWLAVAVATSISKAEEMKPSSTVTANAEPAPPRIFYTRQGEFEIIVQDVDVAQPALELGRAVWWARCNPRGLAADGLS